MHDPTALGQASVRECHETPISAAASRRVAGSRPGLPDRTRDQQDLVNGHPELRGDGLDVAHIQMDEAAWRRVTCVLGQVHADVASRDRNEPREAGLELVLPFLAEPEPFVPLNRPRGICHTQNRHNVLVHVPEPR